MAAQATAQARHATETERSLLQRIKQAEAARTGATEQHRDAVARATAAESALKAANEAAGTANMSLQELQSRLEGERRQGAALQVSA